MRTLITDLDGCIFPTYDVIGKLAVNQLGEVIDWKPMCERNEDPTSQWVQRQFGNIDLYANLKAYQGVAEVLQLARYLEWNVVYLTSRNSTLLQATYFSLGANHLPFSEVTFVERLTARITKAQFALEHKANLFVDDEVAVCKELAIRDIPFIKIPQRYNTDNWKPAMIVQAWYRIEQIVKGAP